MDPEPEEEEDGGGALDPTKGCDEQRLGEASDLAAELLLSQSTEPSSCLGGVALMAAWTAWADGAGLSSRGQAQAAPEPHLGAPPRKLASRLFRAELNRGGSRKWFGLSCAGFSMGGGEGVLLVTGIDSGGCAEAWNDRCSREREPSRRLHMYTAILAVNGTSGDVRRMQQVLEVSRSAELVACSPPTPGAAAAALLAVRDAVPFPPEGPFWASALREFVSAAAGGRAASGDGAGQDGAGAAGATPAEAVEAADVTVIVTTSPVPCNPSTEMLRCVLSSLSLVPGLVGAPRILVCDGFTFAQPGCRPRHKAGKIEPGDDERYAEFLQEVRASVARAAAPGGGSSPYAGLQVLELGEHHGFAFAVRRALQEVKTSFVMVVQHDQEFVRPFDLPVVLGAMRRYPDNIKYVGLSSITTKEYDHMVLSKYGVRLSRTSEFGIPLVPLLFFYDKPHVCSTQHYREVVFGPSSPLRHGDFIEDTLGQAQRSDILQNGLAAHAKYGTFQLDERNEADEPLIVIRHINGRAYWSPEQRVKRGWPAYSSFCV